MNFTVEITQPVFCPEGRKSFRKVVELPFHPVFGESILIGKLIHKVWKMTWVTEISVFHMLASEVSTETEEESTALLDQLKENGWVEV